ncbi:DUF1801 domain-containing protein [Inhella gelatinilytica]|uniref:DUF1801 domain-containing protein n=1 Tax=Inhella gelatinilytica TaxID=2795030 RepID=A0A931NDW3_9BURK|nr:DUF1801 domain-containing protein [Inhella gelatinilytica]MBH9553054.1 DUF1801 domain-containing protein [Inhella gelatinilytica]
MATLKTQPNEASVADYLAARASPEQHADCEVLMALLQRLTGAPPKMWGPSIVGYGRYRYRYASGHAGEWCRSGFAVRGKDLVVYLLAEGPAQGELLSRLGRHKMSKSCLYFKRLSDIDLGVLELLVKGALNELSRRYPDPD